MLITQLSWQTASPILITPSKSHHCRILSTTATTVAFSLPPAQLSRFVNHSHLRHILSTAAAFIVVVSSTVRFIYFLFFVRFKILLFSFFILYFLKLKFGNGQYGKFYFIMDTCDEGNIFELRA